MSMMDPKTNMPSQAQLDWHKAQLAMLSLSTGKSSFNLWHIMPGHGGCCDDGSDNKYHIYKIEIATKAVTLLHGPENGEYHQFTVKCLKTLGYKVVDTANPAINLN